jgi:hypothetical protein
VKRSRKKIAALQAKSRGTSLCFGGRLTNARIKHDDIKDLVDICLGPGAESLLGIFLRCNGCSAPRWEF